MLHIGYLSPSVIALVYDFTFLYKKNWFRPVTYGGNHDCFRFRKHPSSLALSLTYLLQVCEYFIDSQSNLNMFINIIKYDFCFDWSNNKNRIIKFIAPSQINLNIFINIIKYDFCFE